MKKPKISDRVQIDLVKEPTATYYAAVYLDEEFLLSEKSYFMTKREAREWAKGWCRTVGAALLEKGK